MTDPNATGAASAGPAPAPRQEPGVDEQILAAWQALRANPDLDARHALQVIDQLLDRRPAEPRPGPAVEPPPGPAVEPPTAEPSAEPPAGAAGRLPPGSPAQLAALASVLRTLLAGGG